VVAGGWEVTERALIGDAGRAIDGAVRKGAMAPGPTQPIQDG